MEVIYAGEVTFYDGQTATVEIDGVGHIFNNPDDVEALKAANIPFDQKLMVLSAWSYTTQDGKKIELIGGDGGPVVQPS